MLTTTKKGVLSSILALSAIVILIIAYSEDLSDKTADWRELLVNPSCSDNRYEEDTAYVGAAGAAICQDHPPIIDCSICSVAGTLCDELGEKKLIASQAFVGSGSRIRRFLAQARSGDGFTVGVIGVSYGHGLHDGNERISPRLVHRIIFDHLNEMFPARGGVSYGEYQEGKNSFVNGALGATGSDYFSYCFANHIPEETDLVLVEQGINDILSKASFETYELLLRGLLDMPRQPAVLGLQVLALLFESMARGGEVHHGSAQFYDVPMISLQNVILPDILRNHSLVEHYFAHSDKGPDVRHISAAGHKMLGDLAAAYFDTQVCEMKKRGQDHWDAGDFELEPLPRLRLMDRYRENTTIPPLKPTCHSMNVEGENSLVPSRNEGWREWAWEQKVTRISLSKTTLAGHADAQNYLVADEPGSTISFTFTTTIGTVEIYYLRSAEYGLGSARCWVDDEKDKAVILNGYWAQETNVGRRSQIAHGLIRGEHTLHCELIRETSDPGGGTEFRIISLMSM